MPVAPAPVGQHLAGNHGINRPNVGGTWDHGMVKSAVASPTMIGRERELRMLRATLDEAIRGNPRAVVLAGEAGIGKTR